MRAVGVHVEAPLRETIVAMPPLIDGQRARVLHKHRPARTSVGGREALARRGLGHLLEGEAVAYCRRRPTE